MAGSAVALRIKRVLLAVLVVLSLICAWIIGLCRQPVDVTPFLTQVLSQAERFERAEAGVYVGYAEEDAQAREVGYVAMGSALGVPGVGRPNSQVSWPSGCRPREMSGI